MFGVVALCNFVSNVNNLGRCGLQAQAERVLCPAQGQGDVPAGSQGERRHWGEDAAEDGLEQGTGELLVMKTLYVLVQLQYCNIAGAGQGG